MNIAQLYSRICEPWHIDRDSHHALMQAVAMIANANWKYDAAPSSTATADKKKYAVCGGVAVLPVNGALAIRPTTFEKSYLGIVAMDEIAQALEEIAGDSAVNSAVLQVSSPGGTANGSGELAAGVAALNARKPVVAFTDTMMASAAYNFGSQASLIMATPSASVGSIGCMISRMDVSKLFKDMGVEVQIYRNSDSPLKGMGHPAVPLTPAQEERIQEIVDQHAAAFKRDVLAARPAIKAEAMKGQCLFGDKALSTGLVDQHGDLRAAIQTASKLGQWKSAQRV